MCGIAGYFGRFGRSLATDMTRRLAHRGPDGSGDWYDDAAGVGLGHRRLAIIDLSNAAAQPMPGVDGRYQVVFNGEIYNFREHARELEAAGYRFNRHSDTAVLAPLYDRLGPGMLERLNGMFAFALWDSNRRRLFLARDHYGIKPLYYAETPRGFAFASEIKALLAVPGLDRSLDHDALASYLTYQWCPGRITPFHGVKKLPPGHYLEVDATGIRETRWHAPPIGRAHEFDHRPVAELRDDLRRLLDEAVAEQSVSDVDIGVFLSGGVDSSAVTASLVRRKIPVARSYCISFRGPSMAAEGFGDDVEYARDLARIWGIPFTEVVTEAPSLAEFEDMAFALDEPHGDLAPFLVRQISRRAHADGIKVLMSGTGGDDVFTGYRRHRIAWLLDRYPSLARPLGLLARHGMSIASGNLRNRLGKLAHMISAPPDVVLRRMFEFNQPDDIAAVAGPALRDRAARSSAWLDDGLAETAGAPMVERALAGEFLGFLPDHNLAYTDKAAMAEAVEVRVPLLDPRLVEFASHLDPRIKMPRGEPKGFFKEAMTDRLPRAVLDRKKTGFGVPLRHWLAGGLRSSFLDVIRSRAFRDRGLFEPHAAEALLQRSVAGRSDAAYLLLTVVMIELWCRSFADTPSLGACTEGVERVPSVA
jgi:asparagine synthase (glutamine-hydrolysing)